MYICKKCTVACTFFSLRFLSSVSNRSSSLFIYIYLFFLTLSISTFISAQFPPLHSTSTRVPCLVPPPFAPVSRPCEREGVRRLRHSLGCFSTLVPWVEKAPSPLQPLSLPDPTSWYSGFCPCLPGTVLFSSPSPFFLWSASPANKFSFC